MDIRQREHLPNQVALHIERQFQREDMDNHVLCLFLKGCFSASLAQAITSFLVWWLIIGQLHIGVCLCDFFRATLLTKRVIRHHFDLLRFDHVIVRFL